MERYLKKKHIWPKQRFHKIMFKFFEMLILIHSVEEYSTVTK